MYIALVLDKKSRQKLVTHFAQFIPGNYEVVAHHMTINMGKVDSGPVSEQDLGKEASLTVVSIAADDKVIAVGIETKVPSKNSKKHITLAVNRRDGGKPFMSNNLTAWEKLPDPLELTGTILEVQ